MKINKSIIIVSLLTSLFLFHSINNYIILHKDTTPPVIDAMGHFDNSIQYHLNLENGLSFFVQDYFAHSKSYPPFFIFSSLPLYYLFGTSLDVGIMTNCLYLLILIFSVYFIGKKLHDEVTGLLAAFIVTIYPSLFGLSRVYMLDFALTAMVALTICFMLYSDHFRNRAFTILFGSGLGLAFLTKWDAPLFVLGPFLAYLLYSFNLKEIILNGKVKKFLVHGINLVLSLVIALVLSLIWIVPSLMEFLRLMAFENSGSNYRQDSIFYVKELSSQMSSIFVIFLVASIAIIIFYLVSKKLGDRKHRIEKAEMMHLLIMALWFIIPFLYFTFLPWLSHSYSRWTTPYLPALALITALGVSLAGLFGPFKNRKNRLLRPARRSMVIIAFLVALVVVLGLAQFFMTSYSHSILQDSISIYRYGLLSAGTYDWKVDELIMMINETKDEMPLVRVLLTCPLSYHDYLSTRAKIMGLNIRFIDIMSPSYDIFKNINESNTISMQVAEYLDKAAYVIEVEPPRVLNRFPEQIRSELNRLFSQRKNEFQKLDVLEIPERMNLTLYKRASGDQNETQQT